MRGLGRLAMSAGRVCCTAAPRPFGRASVISSDFAPLSGGQVRCAAAGSPQGSPGGAPSKPARGAPGLIGPNGLPLQSGASGSPAEGAEIELTAQNAAQVLQSPAPVLLAAGTLTEAMTKKLGRLRASAQGKLPLVTLDCRKLPQICQALQIKSEPAVFLMSRGQAAAVLELDLSPQSVTAFVEKCAQLLGLQVNLAEGASEQLAEAEELEWQDATAAEEVFKAVSSAADLPQASRARAAAGLARCALRLGRAEEAFAAIEELLASEFDKAPEVKQAVAISQLHKLREASASPQPLETLKAAVEAAPTDIAAVEAYAVGLFWDGKEGDAFDAGLKLLRRKRSDEARKHVLMILEALGPRHPRYAKARKSFSSAVFA